MTTASEAIVHTIPATGNLVEEAHSVADHLREFTRKNRDVLISLVGLVVLHYSIRGMFRRELTRLQFNVEVFPYEGLTTTDYDFDPDL